MTSFRAGDLRLCPSTGRWVMVSRRRLGRPYEYKRSAPASSRLCAFCSIRKPTWLFPSIRVHSPGASKKDCFGTFHHEAIADTLRHGESFETRDLDTMKGFFDYLGRRLAEAKKRRPGGYHFFYKDAGYYEASVIPASGHSHWNLVSLPFVPQYVRRHRQVVSQFHKDKGQCLVCHIAAAEIEHRVRIVEETEHYVALCPFGSILPYSVSVYPKRHSDSFDSRSLERRYEWLALIQRVLVRLKHVFDPLSYHWIHHSSSHECDEIVPRLGFLAGFEWGSGIYINPIPPEEAALKLRGAG